MKACSSSVAAILLAIGAPAAGAPSPLPAEIDRIAWFPEGLRSEDGVGGGIAIDGQGFLWTGSTRGLIRWDGERTRTFAMRGGGPSGTQLVSAFGDVVVANDEDED